MALRSVVTGAAFTGNFGEALQCVRIGLLKSRFGYREERAKRCFSLVSFVNWVHLDDMRSIIRHGELRIWLMDGEQRNLVRTCRILYVREDRQ